MERRQVGATALEDSSFEEDIETRHRRLDDEVA
jgi:hypothetical protein